MKTDGVSREKYAVLDPKLMVWGLEASEMQMLVPILTYHRPIQCCPCFQLETAAEIDVEEWRREKRPRP